MSRGFIAKFRMPEKKNWEEKHIHLPKTCMNSKGIQMGSEGFLMFFSGKLNRA